MAELIINNAFRLATLTLNYLSPSVIADIILHPFDFATVLLQTGFNPEGLKNEATTFVSALAQYALFTFYIPYLFTSMQGVQCMGLPHPSMFYYVTHIYNKEGILGCYRGLLPKICERMVMMYVNEMLKQAINGEQRSRRDASREHEEEKFVQSLVNNLCSQFFAVLAGHPFHVIMISSFAEFMYERKSSMFTLAQFIYEDEGLYGFFIGLTPRLIGELFSLTFSQVYTGLVNKQIRDPQTTVSLSQSSDPNVTPSIVSYLTEVSRFSAFKQKVKDIGSESRAGESCSAGMKKYPMFFVNYIMGLVMPNQSVKENRAISTANRPPENRGLASVFTYLPLTSKVFYYMMIRDYISKKISYPFFLVAHCMIVLDSGWDKLPILPYLGPMRLCINVLVPRHRCD